jgi:hypothetical protein
MNKINDNLYTFEGQQDIVSPQLVYYPAIIRENIRKMIDIAFYDGAKRTIELAKASGVYKGDL